MLTSGNEARAFGIVEYEVAIDVAGVLPLDAACGWIVHDRIKRSRKNNCWAGWRAKAE